MDTEAHQDLINNSHTIFTVLSRVDNLKVFSAAMESLKITKPVLERLGISRAKCLKAIEQLEDAGLIEKEKKEGVGGRELKKSESSYIHTAYGSIVYQRHILEMGKYTKYSDKTEVKDTIKNAQRFSEGVIAMFNEQIINNIVDSEGNSHSVISASTSSTIASSYPSSPSPSISNHENTDGSIDNSTNAIPKARIVLSYDNIVQLLRERVDLCKNEILIATRTSPEIIINRILEKSKMGVQVKVVADTELVRQYFESQKETAANDSNNYYGDNNNLKATNTNDSNDKIKDNETKKNNNIDDDHDYQHQQERRNIVANPYYPNTEIHRRISDLPFSMIILDGSEVGVELVNSNNSKEFFAGVWIKDEEFAMAMKSFYQTIWDKASENISV